MTTSDANATTNAESRTSPPDHEEKAKRRVVSCCGIHIKLLDSIDFRVNNTNMLKSTFQKLVGAAMRSKAECADEGCSWKVLDCPEWVSDTQQVHGRLICHSDKKPRWCLELTEKELIPGNIASAYKFTSVECHRRIGVSDSDVLFIEAYTCQGCLNNRDDLFRSVGRPSEIQSKNETAPAVVPPPVAVSIGSARGSPAIVSTPAISSSGPLRTASRVKPQWSFVWTSYDDIKLKDVMAHHKHSPTVDWEMIAKEHGRGKSAVECHDRWSKNLKTIKKGGWTDEEDALVVSVVSSSAERPFTRWTDLALRLPGRIGKQIRDRYVNHLDPSLNHSQFSNEDDLLLLEGHKQHGKKWVDISTKIFNSTRSENHVKNRWHSATFKKFMAQQMLSSQEHESESASTQQKVARI